MDPVTAASKKQSGLPDKARADKGLSIKGLLRSTPVYYKNKARDDTVTVKELKHTKTKGGMPAVVAKVVSIANRPPRTMYKCSVIGLDKDVPSLIKQKKVLVSCNCESYTYTFEYANWTWGASKIVYCNGEPAVVKNPGNHPGLCKHLYALLAQIVSHNI